MTPADEGTAAVKRDETIPTLKAAIEAALGMDDLDGACAIIQKSLGQTDGGLAGREFSDLHDGDWAKMPLHERADRLREYIRTEISYMGEE